MFHQIYELMVLGMHPAISHSRRSQIRPLDRCAPDAPPACLLIVRAQPAFARLSRAHVGEAGPAAAKPPSMFSEVEPRLRPDQRELGAALGRPVHRHERHPDNKYRPLIEPAAVDVDPAAVQADQVADNRETHTEAAVSARR